MAFIRSFVGFVGRVWRAGCLGKVAVIFAALMIIGMVRGPESRRAAAPAMPVAAPVRLEITATRSPVATPPPIQTPVPTATETPTATPVPTVEPTATAVPTERPTATPRPQWYTSGADRYNCGDFASYAEALAALQVNGPNDPNKLDTDADGIPCETLPGAP